MMQNLFPLLKANKISFSYGNGFPILKEASLELFSGEIVGLIGPNGVGKTTLINLLSGRLDPQTGEISFQNSTSRHLLNTAVAVVEQHLSLYENLSVAQNICIKSVVSKELSFISEKKIEEDANTILNQMGINLPVSAKVSSLAFPQKQLIEIARAIYQRSPVLVLDEPTSALDISSKKSLFSILKKQAQEGYSILLVTHDLDDIEGLTDNVVTVKDGRIEQTKAKRNNMSLNKNMTARAIKASYDLNLSFKLFDSAKSFSFGVNKGEIVVRHLEDALDRSLLGKSLVEPSSNSVKVEVFGQPVQGEPIALKKKGIKVLLSDRKVFGIFPHLSILQFYYLLTNTALPLVKRKASLKAIVDQFDVSALVYPSIDATCSMLSGGNQQKLLWECVKNGYTDFLILEEPLLGLDMMAQERMLNDFSALAGNGVGILVLTCYGYLYERHNLHCERASA